MSGDADTPFAKSFTRQEPLPEAAVERACALLRSGRLHRYDLPPEGETGECAALEAEFARYQGQRYCLACASGGYALQLALRAIGVRADDPVLTNAFTLSPVPGAIAAVGGRPVLVETTEELVIDPDDLDARARASSARFLLLSHMRGHIADMDAVLAVARARGLRIVEDCAHTMGASFDGARSGTHGHIGCFSTQTYKHLNSGEGGLLTSDDATLAARAILLSGSYMLYERHGAAPPPETFDALRLETPNCSGRMDELRAAILRPQLAALDQNAERWNARYRAMRETLAAVPGIRLPRSHPKAREVSSSIQFFTETLDDAANARFLERCAERGVTLKWFGRAEPQGYTSDHRSWRYVPPSELPRTDATLRRLHDCRIPLTFGLDDCRRVAAIVGETFSSVADGG